MQCVQEVARTVFWAIAQYNSRHMSHGEKVYLRGIWPRMNNLEDNVIGHYSPANHKTLSTCKGMYMQFFWTLIQNKINVWNLGDRNILSRNVLFGPWAEGIFHELEIYIAFFVGFWFFPYPITSWVGSRFGTWLGVFHRKKIYLFIVKLPIIWREQTEKSR